MSTQAGAKLINLNADMGESFGRYVLGDDAALIPYLNSINVACGYHAADPGTMRKSVELARRHGVELGAHISYPDLPGFGRRQMVLSEEEVFEISVYQIGALLGFCRAAGVPLTHVKPHGELFLAGVRNPIMARGIARAVKAVDPDLILLMAGENVARACAAVGVKMAYEGYVDLNYNPDGTVLIERTKQSRPPEAIAERAVALAEKQGCHLADGSWLAVPTQSICIHGDGPNAPAIAKAVQDSLVAAGYRMASLRELVS
jgi:UPF0271 protein